MESRPNFHPVYVSGQYLTSEHLNETHNFLWQEEKATRYALAGNGIVQGLQGDFSGSALLQNISLTTGGGSTIDGYLVQNSNLAFNRGVAITLSRFILTGDVQRLMEKVEFDKIKDNLELVGEPAELDAIELLRDSLTTEELPDGAGTLESFAIPASQALNKILLAWVSIKDAENNHCQQGDCNTKGIQRNYVTRYFLVDSGQFPVLNTVSPEMPVCSVSRIKNLSDAGSTEGLHQRSFTAWNSGTVELSPYFSNAVSGKQLGIIAALLSTEDQTALTNGITKFAQIKAGATTTNCSQYYAGFAADLCRAINELVVFYNDYAKKYPVIDPKRIEQVIILGALRSTGIDKWRYYFIPAPQQVQYEFDRKMLKALFRRVLAMVNNFIAQSSIGEQSGTVAGRPLAIPTVTGDVLLQNCAIPYYYSITNQGVDNEILKYWNPQGGQLKNVFSYYDSKVTSRSDMAAKLQTTDWLHHNFFRIEGHVGMPKQTAFSALSSLIASLGLPIQLVECDINYKGPKKWFDWFDKFILDVDKWTGTLRKDYTEYDYAPIKNIQTKIKQTSYRNVTEVAKIANDFYAYSNLFYNTTPPTGDTRATGTPSKVIPGDAYIRFQSIVPKAEIAATYNNFKEAVNEQKDLQAQKLITLRDLVDIEYMGGAPRGGTFVLLHNGNTVIGDGCLPYYYRINQVRVFSV